MGLGREEDDEGEGLRAASISGGGSCAGMAAVLKVLQASVTMDEEPFLDKGLLGTKTT